MFVVKLHNTCRRAWFNECDTEPSLPLGAASQIFKDYQCLECLVGKLLEVHPVIGIFMGHRVEGRSVDTFNIFGICAWARHQLKSAAQQLNHTAGLNVHDFCSAQQSLHLQHCRHQRKVGYLQRPPQCKHGQNSEKGYHRVDCVGWRSQTRWWHFPGNAKTKSDRAMSARANVFESAETTNSKQS